jgi:hypothetical protein
LTDLAPELRDLISGCFDSAESIEIVLLLRRSPDTFWSPVATAQQLGIREEVARTKMMQLASARLIVPAEHSHAFRYAPADEEMRKRIDELADAYSERRIAVINTIYSANLEKLRTFSDAFRLKKP